MERSANDECGGRRLLKFQRVGFRCTLTVCIQGDLFLGSLSDCFLYGDFEANPNRTYEFLWFLYNELNR